MPFVRVYRDGVEVRFVRSALLLAVATCDVLLFEAMPGLFSFLRVTPVCCGPQKLEDCAAVISCAWFYWLDPR